jgi:chemotaxis-related protein WspD
VYSAGAAALLDADAPASYFADRTATSPSRRAPRRRDAVGRHLPRRVEWLALPTRRRSKSQSAADSFAAAPAERVVLGLASVRGELLVCVSLRQVVGADRSRGRDERGTRLPAAARDPPRGGSRGLSGRRSARHSPFHPRELTDVPTTVAKATVTYSTALLPWQGHSVGTLDDQLLFYTLKRSLE